MHQSGQKLDRVLTLIEVVIKKPIMSGKALSWVDQKSKLYPLTRKELKKGDEWFLVDNAWFKQWECYIGVIDDEENENELAGLLQSNPGIINNEDIIDLKRQPISPYGPHLKQKLSENVDYAFIPKEVWEPLVKIYGIENNQSPLKRYVIEIGEASSLKIELYLTRIRLCKIEDYGNGKNLIEKYYGCKTQVAKISQDALQAFNLESSKLKNRLWLKETRWVLLKEKKCLDHLGIGDNEIMYLETSKNSFKNSDSPYFINNSNSVSNEEPMDDSNDQENHFDELSCVFPSGLSNMGNTCFMNSALQCLLSSRPLTYYLSTHKWRNDLNESNPLGCKGLVAKAYAELVKDMHNLKSSKQMSSIMPRQFKIAVSRFAPQFSGWAQHDSQELLAFLLDGLHEDLNRVRQKPYIEIKESDGRPDSEVARDSWTAYRKRNDSIIIDTFHGQLKSTLVCPECAHVSVTFDPYCFLSLPLPQIKNRKLTITLLRKHFQSEPTVLTVDVDKNGRIFSLCESVANAANKRKLEFHINKSSVSSDNLVVADIHSHHLSKTFNPNDGINSIYDRDDIYIFEIEAIVKGRLKDGYKCICVYERVPTSSSMTYHKSFKTVGHPVIMAVPIDITRASLLESILSRFKRYLDVSKSNIEAYKQKHMEPSSEDENLYELRFVNMYGNAQVENMDEEKPLKTNDNIQYISLDWEAEQTRKFFIDSDAERRIIKESSLTPQSDKEIQLLDCLELFTNQEKLSASDPWYCPKCKKHQEATKKLDLWSLPDILVIHLKRFTYSRWWRDKLDARVDFPIKNLNLKQFVLDDSIKKNESAYDLIAVSNHMGGMGGGHYTAYANRGEKWCNFDDSIVSHIGEEQIVSGAAYVLIYERRQPKYSKRI